MIMLCLILRLAIRGSQIRGVVRASLMKIMVDASEVVVWVIVTELLMRDREED